MREFLSDKADRANLDNESYYFTGEIGTNKDAETVYRESSTYDVIITLSPDLPSDIVLLSGKSDDEEALLFVSYGNYTPVKGEAVAKKLTGDTGTASINEDGDTLTVTNGAFNTELKKGGTDWAGAILWGYNATNSTPWMRIGDVVSITDNNTAVIDDGSGGSAPGAGLSFTYICAQLTGTSHMEWGRLIGTSTEYVEELPGGNEKIYKVGTAGQTSLPIGTVNAITNDSLGTYTEEEQWVVTSYPLTVLVGNSPFLFDPKLVTIPKNKSARIRMETSGNVSTGADSVILNVSYYQTARLQHLRTHQEY